MKIRNGFVSNSSSSSFIVVFPKKPKSVNEVKKYLFGDENSEGFLHYYDDKESHDRIAEQVFSDLNEKSLTKNKVIKMFNSGWRYSYCVDGYNTADIVDGKLVLLSKEWAGSGEPFFGNDKESMHELMKLEIDHDKKQNEYWDKHHRIQKRLKSTLGEEPDYKDKKAYNAYNKKLQALEKKDKEWIEFKKNDNLFDNTYWNKRNELSAKCAKADVEEFMKETKGKYKCDFHYADEDGSFFALMEHGNIFKKLMHLRFSHH